MVGLLPPRSCFILTSVIGYVIDDKGKYHFWIGRRAATKKSCPNMLDVTVAGGITARDVPLETVFRESMEEASLKPAYLQERIKAVGLVSYVWASPKGWLCVSNVFSELVQIWRDSYPEFQFIYDLQFPTGQSVVPKPNDDEVESFQLRSANEVLQLMLDGEFVA